MFIVTKEFLKGGFSAALDHEVLEIDVIELYTEDQTGENLLKLIKFLLDCNYHQLPIQSGTHVYFARYHILVPFSKMVSHLDYIKETP